MLRGAGTLRFDRMATPVSAARVLRDGILLNILNPKLSVFFVAFLLQFIEAANLTPLGAMAGLSLVLMAVTVMVFTIYGVFAAAMWDQVAAWPRRGFAAAFGGLAMKLAVTDR